MEAPAARDASMRHFRGRLKQVGTCVGGSDGKEDGGMERACVGTCVCVCLSPLFPIPLPA